MALSTDEINRAADALLLERRSPKAAAARRAEEQREAARTHDATVRTSLARHLASYFPGMSIEAAEIAAKGRR